MKQESPGQLTSDLFLDAFENCGIYENLKEQSKRKWMGSLERLGGELEGSWREARGELEGSWKGVGGEYSSVTS